MSFFKASIFISHNERTNRIGEVRDDYLQEASYLLAHKIANSIVRQRDAFRLIKKTDETSELQAEFHIFTPEQFAILYRDIARDLSHKGSSIYIHGGLNERD